MPETKQKPKPAAKKRGGKRLGAGPPFKMMNATRCTLLLEKSTERRLKKEFGRKWAEYVRALIDANQAREAGWVK